MESETKEQEVQETPPEEPVMQEDIVVTENEKAYAAALRRVLGVEDSEELDHLEERISDLEKKHADIVTRAKETVINAEIKALHGYDAKLLSRLLDRSKITVDENGRVTGFEEALKSVEDEFPSVRLPEKPAKPFVPVNAAGSTETGLTMNELIRGKR